MRTREAAGRGGTGIIGLVLVLNEFGTPTGLPGPAPGMYGPEVPMDGGPSSLVAGMLVGIRLGILSVMSLGLLGASVFVPVRILGAGASPRGLPRLTGVESARNSGKPAGRSSGKTSNTATANACKPNEVKAVNPRRERSSHDELSVSSNMASS